MTGVTITDVYYPQKDRPDFTFITDSAGKFSSTYSKIGLMGCTEPFIRLGKEGYIGFEAANQHFMDTVWMEVDSVYTSY